MITRRRQQSSNSTPDIRHIGKRKIANRLENLLLVVRVDGYPNVHVDRISDIAKGVHGITADQQKPCVMRIEQLQELFEIAWYPGRSHSGSAG